MEKMTNSKALAFALETLKDTAPADVLEKLTNIKASIDKKNSADRKPTATQTENVAIKSALVEFLGSCDKPQTISDIMKGCSAVAEMSNQKVSALVRQLKEEGTVIREEIKRKAYFSLADGSTEYLDIEVTF